MLKRLLILITSILFLSGCSKQTQETLNFTSWGSVTEVKILKQIISDFEKENPNVKVNFIHTPQNYFQKLHLLFASNSAPDVVFINNLYLPIYATQLEDLSNLFNQKDFYPQALESLSYNGKQLAIPRDISNLILYINTDKIDTKTYANIEELLLTAQKSTTKDSWGIGIEEDIYFIQPYLAYFGEIFNENLDYKSSKGINFYTNLRNKYKVAPINSQIGSSTLAQMFLEQKIAIYLSGRWMYPQIKEKATFNWEITSFPKGIAKFPCDASGWAISKKSKNKEVAIKFVQYLSNENSSEYFAQTGLIVPARVKASEILNNTEHNEKVFLDIIPESKNTFVPINYKKLTDKFNHLIFN